MPIKDTDLIAVVIPCYNVKRHILGVISAIGSEVSIIVVVDDNCPENSGSYVEENSNDPRVQIIKHKANTGVGGAVMSGYIAAIELGATILVKVDGDGQMPPELIPAFIDPIKKGEADYTKGNRFYDLRQIQQMPKTRIFGNACLSFLSKLSTGYWNMFDPTNGFTAIHARILQHLPLEKISRRYFFETDILFRLNTIRAVVTDIPMDAKYGEEKSNLKIKKVAGEFLYKNISNTIKRLFYNYYLRDVSIASLELPFGIVLLLFGTIFGSYTWLNALNTQNTTPTGTIMLSVLPIILGFNLILAFLNFDITSIPRQTLHTRIANTNKRPQCQN